MFSYTGLIAALFGASAVQAHMLMNSPVPYGKGSLSNSPLAADGSDFPCKQRSGVYEITQMNELVIGQENPLTFKGSAVHGGGSCQVSLTKDMEPTKNSKWMVIKSIEGGCPANVGGNLPADANGDGASKFQYVIPEGIEPGKYTLAWTWFNRIGNREMYMNCAPVNVKGGVKRSLAERSPAKRESSFPPMFVANINGCTTKEGIDIRFPNPGAVLERAGNPSNLAPESSRACTGSPSFGGDGNAVGSGGSSGAAGSSGNGESHGPGSQPTAPTQTSPGGVFKPTTQSSKPTFTNLPTGSGPGSNPGSGSNSGSGPGSNSGSGPGSNSGSGPGSNSGSGPGSNSGSGPGSNSGSGPGSNYGPGSNSDSDYDYDNGSSSSSSGSSSSSSAISGACSSEGQWNCINGSSFQRCANGRWTSAQVLAEGTKCAPGQGSDLTITALKPRMLQEMRYRRRHVAHHA